MYFHTSTVYLKELGIRLGLENKDPLYTVNKYRSLLVPSLGSRCPAPPASWDNRAF